MSENLAGGPWKGFAEQRYIVMPKTAQMAIMSKSDENQGIREGKDIMRDCKEYKITVTMGIDYSVNVKASDYDSASRMGEEYVKRHFLELEPEDKSFIREVRAEEVD
jgi:hypothetical protein